MESRKMKNRTAKKKRSKQDICKGGKNRKRADGRKMKELRQKMK